VAPEEALMTIEEVAAALNVSIPTVRKWKADGRIRHVKIGSILRFRPDDIRAFIAASIQHPTEEVG
jgi:excisionase family DNA binding protein